jgi:hypothetical protein
VILKGDRVAVYVTLDGIPYRSTGKCTNAGLLVTIEVELDAECRHTGQKTIIAHRKQCRKLVRKLPEKTKRQIAEALEKAFLQGEPAWRTLRYKKKALNPEIGDVIQLSSCCWYVYRFGSDGRPAWRQMSTTEQIEASK